MFFLLLPILVAGETEAWESSSIEHVRGRSESRSRVRAACLPVASPKIQLLCRSQENIFLRCSVSQRKAPLALIWVLVCLWAFGDRSEVSPSWKTSAVNGPGVIYSPPSSKLLTWISAPKLLCVIGKAAVKVEGKKKKKGGRGD